MSDGKLIIRPGTLDSRVNLQSADTWGRLLKRVLNLSRGLSIISNTFEQNINVGYDIVFVLITGRWCSVSVSTKRYLGHLKLLGKVCFDVTNTFWSHC